MLEARRSKVIKVIGVIALVFGVSLIYFLFFNTGLMLTPDPSDQGGKVIVSNTSVHLIRDISVHFMVNNQKVEAEIIPVLAPNETHSVSLLEQYISDGKFVVQVSAPYHLTQQVIIQARSDQVNNADVSFTFQYPSLAIVNQPVDVEVGACNAELFALDVKVAIDLPPELTPVSPVDWVIPSNNCVSLPLTFIPTLVTDDLSFKIRVFTPTRVLVEKDHHL
ncbi:MAG: hypothetical protein AABX02_04835, partial [archaeon]